MVVVPSRRLMAQDATGAEGGAAIVGQVVGAFCVTSPARQKPFSHLQNR